MCPVIKMQKLVSIITALLAFATISTLPALAQGAIAPASTLGGPNLSIITPSEGQTIYKDSVPMLVKADNFELVNYQNNPTKTAGQGHIHMWLDDQNPTKDSAVKVTSDTYTFQDVAYGDHKLVAELVSSDPTSLTPPVTVTVNFKTAPAASPSATVPSGFDKNPALVILVVVALVIAAAWWYTKEEDETPESSSTNRKPRARKTARRSRRK